MFNGFYLHGEGQVGAFHPVHLLLYGLLPLPAAFNLEIILAYVFAFAGMWLFLARLNLQPASRALGAMAFTFSGYLLLHLGHVNAVEVSAHIPWLLLALDTTLSSAPRRRYRGAAGLSLLIGSQLLLGYPQYVLLSAMACACFVVTRLREGARLRHLWPAVSAAVAGLMIGGIQLLPTADLLTESTRAAVTREFQLSFSLHPLNLMQLWSPYLFPERVVAPRGEYFVHEFGVYNGAFATLAIVWALTRRHHSSLKSARLFAGLLCIVGVVLALGSYGVVYEHFVRPVLGVFRAPTRHLLLVHVGLAILVAVLFEDLITSRRAGTSSTPVSRWLWLPLCLSVLTAIVVLTWRPLSIASAGGVGTLVRVLGSAVVFVVATVVLQRAWQRDAALVVLPALLAIDLGLWGYSYVFQPGPVTPARLQARADGLTELATGRTAVHDETDISINYWMLRDARVFRPYVGMSPRLALSSTSELTLRVAGVEWMRTRGEWRRVADPMPRARLVADARASDDPAVEIERIDVTRTALTDRRIASPLVDPKNAAIAIVADGDGRIELDVESSGDALLVLTESYHSGWKATTAGRTLETLRVYGDFLGVLLPPGRYRLGLEFDPSSFRYGKYATFAGLSIAGLWVVVAYRVDRRSEDRRLQRSSTIGV